MPKWYALYTRPRFEKKVDLNLKKKGFESYLPLLTVLRRWSDRWKKVGEPLFSCYVFVRVPLKERVYAMQTDGVVRMVSFNGLPSPIADHEISAVKKILEETDFFESTHFLAIGQRVEVIRGPLEGVLGRLTERRGQKKLLVGIEQIGQGISVEVSENDLQAIVDQSTDSKAA